MKIPNSCNHRNSSSEVFVIATLAENALTHWKNSRYEGRSLSSRIKSAERARAFLATAKELRAKLS